LKSHRSFALWKRIHSALEKEVELGYSNGSIKNGFTVYIRKTFSEDWFIQEYPSSLRDKLSKIIIVYEKNPCEDTFHAMLSTIGELQDYWDHQIPTAVMQDILLKPLQYCKGFGPKRAHLLSRLDIRKIVDFLYTFPKSWIDRRKTSTILEAYSLQGETVQIQAKIAQVSEQKRGGYLITNLVARDRTGYLIVSFVNQKYVKKLLGEHLNDPIFLSGKIQYQYGKLQMSNPSYEIPKDPKHPTSFQEIQPVYKLTEGLSQNVYRQLIRQTLLEHIIHIPEFFSSSVRIQEHLMHRAEALSHMHFPLSFQIMEEARKRLVLDEFLFNQ
jgi:ATP-dependent DNA helicase RecG